MDDCKDVGKGELIGKICYFLC